jgi:hypothetical protein
LRTVISGFVLRLLILLITADRTEGVVLSIMFLRRH